MVLPTVAEVVDVSERSCADVFDHIGEARLAGVERTVRPARIGNAPADIADADLVEMRVGPAHRRLDEEMQAIKPYIERRLDTADDRGLHVVEGDLQAGDGGGAHAASLRCSLSRAQRHGNSAARSVMA